MGLPPGLGSSFGIGRPPGFPATSLSCVGFGLRPRIIWAPIKFQKFNSRRCEQKATPVARLEHRVFKTPPPTRTQGVGQAAPPRIGRRPVRSAYSLTRRGDYKNKK